MLGFLLGGFIPPSEFRENPGFAKVNMDEISLKHRSEEMRNRNSISKVFECVCCLRTQ
jgi:hypothetical protein